MPHFSPNTTLSNTNIHNTARANKQNKINKDAQINYTSCPLLLLCSVSLSNHPSHMHSVISDGESHACLFLTVFPDCAQTQTNKTVLLMLKRMAFFSRLKIDQEPLRESDKWAESMMAVVSIKSYQSPSLVKTQKSRWETD